MLKASFHLHTGNDPRDHIPYTNYQAIDKAAKLKFDVIAITCHNKVVFSEGLKAYAASKNILLIPGIEKSIEFRHVLILNADKDAEQINTFEKLQSIKPRKNWLTIIAHPFFPPISLWSKSTIANMDLFDAVEYSFFYSNLINFNRKAREIAQTSKKPLIGTSDIHILNLFEETYTLIDAEKNTESIFKAIRENKVSIISKPFHTYQLPMIFGHMIGNKLYTDIKKKFGLIKDRELEPFEN